MFWILLDSIGVHTVHVLRAVMCAQMRTQLPIRTSLPEGPRILLLVNARTGAKTIASVETALKRTGGRVRRATERTEAEQWVQRWDPEVLVLLGWSAATGDWLQRWPFAADQDDLPFLVVSSGLENHERADAVAALEAGAQAYLPASMGFEPLTAQVRNVLKKVRTQTPVRMGEEESLCIDLASLRVWVLGQEIHLPRRLFSLLHYFVLHPDEVISNEQIADILWGGRGAYLAPNTLVVKIYRLRKILESAGARGWLETVHSFGYRFSPPQGLQNVIKRSPQ